MKKLSIIVVVLAVIILVTLQSINHLKEKESKSVESPAIETPKSPQSKSTSETNKMNNKVILVIDEWAPFTGEKLENYGLCSEIVTAALKAGGLEAEYQFRPWARTLEMVKFGDAWGTFPWFFTEERSKNYYYSDLVIISKSKIFYHVGNPKLKESIPEYNILADLKAFKFGGVSGYFYEEQFSKEKFDYNLSSSLESAFKLLETNRVDFILEDEAVGMHTIKKLYPKNMDAFMTLTKTFKPDDFMYLMVSKVDPQALEKLNRFNEGLKIIRLNGTYDEIFKKYGITR